MKQKDKNLLFLSPILIICLGAIVYSNSLHCSFHFDDSYFIVDNFSIRNIYDLLSIWKYYPCRFFTFFSIAFNYHLHQLNVVGYHLFNLAVHLISATLVWWLVLLTLSTPAMKDNKITEHANLIALLAGLIFVSHPVQTESITYLWQRAASLTTLFYLASLNFYIKSRLLQNKRPASNMVSLFYVSSLLMAIVAMLTKEISITLPLMILLYEVTFLKDIKNLNWKYLSPFLLTLFIIPLITLLSHSEKVSYIQGTAAVTGGLSAEDFTLTQFRVMSTFIRLVFLPLNLNLDYDYPITKSIFELPAFLSLLLLIVIIFFATRLFSKYRLISFSIFWFFLTLLLPEALPLTVRDVIFEHRLYLPLVGYSIFFVGGAYYLFGKNTIKAMVIALTLIIAVNSILTYQRNKIWTSELTLWQDVIRKSPHKARSYNNLGRAYYNEGNYDQALLNYNKAIEINPNYAEAHNNRALCPNHSDLALLDLNKAIELKPTYSDAYNNRGNVYISQGHYDLALLDLNKALELNPNYPDAYSNRGNVYIHQGHYDLAFLDLNKAIELNPNYSIAYNNRGSAYDSKNNYDQAILDFNKAIELNPNYPEAYNNRGNTYNSKGNYDQAILDFNKAIELNPNFPDAYINRGTLFGKKNNYTEAILNYAKAIDIDPKCEKAYFNQGIIYEKKGNLDEAILNYTKAIELNPRLVQAYANRGSDYNNKGHLKQSILDYSKAIELNPNDAPTYSNRAIVYYNQKEYTKALNDLQKAQKLGAKINLELLETVKKASVAPTQ